MFYSQTYLGRKGPLGTVWCAAFLQHRLKKSHYLSTDLLKTIDYIIYSEVPIALRMSALLLLGVVRIYSKKMDYLYRECNIVLTRLEKVSVQPDLPEDARQASPQAITLPSTFQLDALDMDDLYYLEGDQDTHVKDRDEITLIDQVPTGRDPYVAISFDEDVVSTSEGPQAPPDSTVRPGDTGTLPMTVPWNMEADTRGTNQVSPNPDPSTRHGETPPATEHHSHVQSIPEIEIMRDAAQDFSMDMFPPLADHQNLEDLVMSQFPDDKRAPSPIMEGVLASGGTSPHLMQHSKHSAASNQAPEIDDAHVTFDHATPELAIRPSPPVQQPRPRRKKRKQFPDDTIIFMKNAGRVQQPRPRRKKRKQFLDETITDTNGLMKNAGRDTRDMLWKRKSIPCSSLALSRSNKHQRKEQVLDEPTISDEDPETVVRTTPCSINEALSNGRAAESPLDMPSFDMEIERFCDDGCHDASSACPEFSHLPAKSMQSPSTRGDSTPLSSNFPSASDLPGETTVGTSVLPIPDAGASTGTFGSNMETPLTFLDEYLPVDNTRLSDIPGTRVEDEDLFFLEADSSSPDDVVQYLRKHSPTSSVTRESENLSLNKILEGKKRRLCARMFFEILVLKTNEGVDVQQAEAYGDISLKLLKTNEGVDVQQAEAYGDISLKLISKADI